MDVPLVTLPFTYRPAFLEAGATRGKTDVVLITDGLMGVPARVRENFNVWKTRESVKLQTLIIACPQAGELATVSDAVYLVPCLDVGQGALADVLSL